MTPFITGFTKAASQEEENLRKAAYAEKLTKLLQRKGKLPSTATPTVGTSSFPKSAGLTEGLAAGVGGLAGLGVAGTAMLPTATTLAGAGVGGLAGYLSGRDKKNPENDHSGRNALLGALAGGAAGYGTHSLSKNVILPGLLPPPQSVDLPASLNLPDLSKHANDDLMAQLLEYARDPRITAGVGAGLGGLAGYASGGPDEENPENDTSLRNAILGALAGGGLGYGAGKGIDFLNTEQVGDLPPPPSPSYKGAPASPPKLELGQGGQLNFDPSMLSAGQSSRNAPPSALTGLLQQRGTPRQKDVQPAIQGAQKAISGVNIW